MGTTQLEADLLLRIDQSQNWLSKAPEAIKGFKFRKDTTWEALPTAFLDEQSRVERHGVRFRFYVTNYHKKIEVEIDVRIHPETEVKDDGESPPYVVTYVVDQLTGADVEITHRDLIHPSLYKDLQSLSIEDWYRYWIEKAIKHKKASKIFSKDMELKSG